MNKLFKEKFLALQNYDQQTNDWGMNCKVPGIQSPIDINVSKQNFNQSMFDSNLKMLQKDTPEDLKFKWRSNVGQYLDFIKEGKQENVYNKYELEDNFLYDGQDVVYKFNNNTTAKYKLARVYFKTSSEHSINGKQFPMEIQFEHVLDPASFLVDKTTYISQNYAMKLTISVFAKMGTIDHLLTDMWSYISQANTVIFKTPKDAGNIQIEFDVKLNLSEVFQIGLKNRFLYASYQGTDTHPPCDQKTLWIVSLNTIQVDLPFMRKIEKYQRLFPSTSRPIQKKGRRLIRYGRQIGRNNVIRSLKDIDPQQQPFRNYQQEKVNTDKAYINDPTRQSD